jgi:hypothetical protein
MSLVKSLEIRLIDEETVTPVLVRMAATHRHTAFDVPQIYVSRLPEDGFGPERKIPVLPEKVYQSFAAQRMESMILGY